MLEWVTQNAALIGADANHLVIGGDSAGGGIAAVALMARDNDLLPPLRFQGLIYPSPDLTLNQHSVVEFAEGYGLTRAGAEREIEAYAPPGVDRRAPYASPLWADDLRGLAPALVITAEYDPLRDSGEAYAERLREAGIAVESTRYHGMIHNFVLMAGVLEQGKCATEQYAKALRHAFAE